MRNVPLIVSQLLLLCSAGLTVAEQNRLVGHWSGDETQGTRVIDSSGHGSEGLSTGPLFPD